VRAEKQQKTKGRRIIIFSLLKSKRELTSNTREKTGKKEGEEGKGSQRKSFSGGENTDYKYLLLFLSTTIPERQERRLWEK